MWDADDVVQRKNLRSDVIWDEKRQRWMQRPLAGMTDEDVRRYCEIQDRIEAHIRGGPEREKEALDKWMGKVVRCEVDCLVSYNLSYPKWRRLVDR